MDEADREAAFLAALNNEYFVLQSAASNTVAESGSRASLYVFSLSSSLIAFGFVSQSERAFAPFLSIVLPTLFVLGLFTTVRLVDTGIQNVSHLRAMARIRRYWSHLTPEASEFFGTAAPDDAHAALESLAVRWEDPLAEFFTIASMIAVVNSVVGGAGVTLLVYRILDTDQGLALPLTLGIIVGLFLLTASYVYQHIRYVRLAGNV